MPDTPAPQDDPRAGSVDPMLYPASPFAEADWVWFLDRCQILGIDDPSGFRPAIEALYAHLVGVNAWLNLTRIAGVRDYLKWHVLDSLSGLIDKRIRHLSEGAPCVDLGSGAGYPGLPLILVRPRIPWVLIDARRKKAEFLTAALTLLPKHRSQAKHLRAGEVGRAAPELRRRCQLVVARAVGQAAALLAEAKELLAPHGHVVIYKGPAYEGDERQTAEKACDDLGYRAVHVHRLRLEDGDPERVLAVFERIR